MTRILFALVLSLAVLAPTYTLAAVDAGASDDLLSPGAVAPAPVPEADPAKALYEAVSGGNWSLAAAAIVCLLVLGVKLYGVRIWAPLGSPVASAILALVGGVAGGLVNAMVAGMSIGAGVFLDGLRVGIMAALPYVYLILPKAKAAAVPAS